MLLVPLATAAQHKTTDGDAPASAGAGAGAGAVTSGPAAHTTAASSPPQSVGVEFAAVDPVEYDANTGVAWAVCVVAAIRTSRSVRSFRLFC